MKLTLKWSDAKGEGYADAKEVAALMRDPDITTLDFLRDAVAGVSEIYLAALEQHIMNGSQSGIRPESEALH